MIVTPLIVQVHPGAEDPFETVCQVYVKTLREGFYIPAGFRFDGASVPWFFTTILPRFSPRMLVAAVAHDFLYRAPNHHSFTRERADQCFKEILLGLGMNRAKVTLAFWGVRLGGRFSWK